MVEEKKDSFTFSDKIKSSKPAVNPLSKRGSKVGNNGKPKKTLFERTRRDAPFFIAALLALLLLPFLYRYSGTVHDEGAIVTPGYGDSVFDPERFGFSPSVEDPTDQIVQLTGRDPLSLIKGWSDADEAAAPERDGLDDEMYTPAPRRQDTPDSYRRTAPAATRAAFKRAATPIKEMGHASMNIRSGGGIGGQKFGGANLKQAAGRDSSSKPKEGVKPVSLQPLRAAGTSRTYFGQGGAAQARASRNAMSKADAVRAIQDAVFTPVESRRIGGLGDGVFAAGGGAGKWDRNMNFKGITPWWWDMMKQQEMEKWKWKYFLWRKPLADAIATIMGEVAKSIGLALGNWTNCLLTGNDKGDMGTWGAAKAHEGKPGGCKIAGGDVITYAQALELKAAGEKAWEDWYLTSEKGYKNECKEKGANEKKGKTEWVDAVAPTPKMNYVQRVRHCWNEDWLPKGNAGMAYVKECNGEVPCQCENFKKEHVFEVEASGKAAKWKNRYIVVLATNIKKGDRYLCQPSAIKTVDVAGAGQAGQQNNAAYKNTNSRTHADKVSKDGRTHDPKKGKSKKGKQFLNEDDPCVIYVAKGDKFNYNAYKEAVGDVVKRAGFTAEEVIPLAVEGYVMEGAPGNAFNSNWRTGLPILKKMPMSLTDFKKQFLPKDSSSYYGGEKDKVFCEWPGFSIKAKDIESVEHIKAVLTFDPEVYGNKAENLTVTVDRIVDEGAGEEIFGKIEGEPIIQDACLDGVCRYHLDVEKANVKATLNKGISNSTADNPFIFRVYWKATNKAGKSDKDDAGYTTGSKPAEDQTIKVTAPQACEEDSTVQLAGYENCFVKQVCENGQYKAPVLIGNGCPKAGGSGAGKLYFLAQSMDKVAQTINNHRSYTFGQENQPQEVTGEVFYSNFKKDNKNDDLKQLNEGTVNASGAHAAFAFVQGVVAKVNEGLPQGEQLLSLAEGSTPRLSEFVDALHLGQDRGMGQVSKAAVCEFARGVVLASNDPTYNLLHNTFGTFAIYIATDSAYFPNQQVKVDTNSADFDMRFCNPKRNSSICKPEYWWGGYVLNHTHAICATSRQQIEATGFPLKDLYTPSSGRVPVEGIQGAVDRQRTRYVDSYGVTLFAQNGKCAELQGTMPVADVLKYVQKVIELGLGYKPKGCGLKGETAKSGSGRGTSSSIGDTTGSGQM